MYSISFKTNINAPASVVFKALTNQELLTRWFAPQVIAIAKERTIAAFAFEFDLNFKVDLVKLTPDKLVQWQCIDGYKEWLDSEICFCLEPDSNKTKLIFEHKNLINDAKKEKTTSSWNEYLEKLKTLSESL